MIIIMKLRTSEEYLSSFNVWLHFFVNFTSIIYVYIYHKYYENCIYYFLLHFCKDGKGLYVTWSYSSNTNTVTVISMTLLIHYTQFNNVEFLFNITKIEQLIQLIFPNIFDRLYQILQGLSNPNQLLPWFHHFSQ